MADISAAEVEGLWDEVWTGVFVIAMTTRVTTEVGGRVHDPTRNRPPAVRLVPNVPLKVAVHPAVTVRAAVRRGPQRRVRVLYVDVLPQ